MSNDVLLELDRSGRKFEVCLDNGEPVLNLADLKLFLPSTCNLDPYLNKIIRGSFSMFDELKMMSFLSFSLSKRFTCLFLFNSS